VPFSGEQISRMHEMAEGKMYMYKLFVLFS